MERESKGTSSAEVSLILRLLEAGNTDTLYRDLYLERAHMLTGALLPHLEYLRLKYSKVEIDDLLRQVAPALERQEWVKVHLTTMVSVSSHLLLLGLMSERYQKLPWAFFFAARFVLAGLERRMFRPPSYY